MEFYEERERMRKLLQSPGSMGRSGVMGNAGTSGYGRDSQIDYKSSGSTINPNLYVTSGTTENNVSTEKSGKKVKFNIQPIESERERVKTNWKFWKK